MARFTWLHFTDLHVGMDGSYRWPAKRDEVLDDLRRLLPRLGRVDAILFTGDLTQRGTQTEFDAFDRELARVRSVLREAGSDPVLLAVPGNHDLVRPEDVVGEVDALRSGHVEDLWARTTSASSAVVRSAFESWSTWAERGPTWDGLEGVRREGLLPGDFLATWSRDDLRIGIVGLNSAAVQLGPGDYEGYLALDLRQLTALEPEVDEWARSHDACLLLTHHPESWLSPAAQAEFREAIYLPERFVLHLCGHNHRQRSVSVSEGFAEERRNQIGRSLFGREHFADGTEDRLFGYSAGCIELVGGTRRWRLWPRVDLKKQDGTSRLGPDPDATLVPNQPHTRWRDLGPSPRRRPAAGWTLPVLDSIAEFLERHCNVPRARRSLLEDAGVTADPARTWSAILPGLEPHEVQALLRELLEDDREGVERQLALLEPRPPADSLLVVEGLLEARFSDAARHFEREEFEDAARLYGSIAESAAALGNGEYARRSRARALVNQAAALNSIGGEAAKTFKTLLRSGSIDIDAVPARGRINLARLFLATDDPDGARQAVEGLDDPGVKVIRQLLQLAAGTLPEDPVDDADVLLSCAARELDARRCARAIDLASRASREPNLSERGRQRAAELIGRSLFLHWLGESFEEVPTPGVALLRLEDLSRTTRRRADWALIDELVQVCNELPLRHEGTIEGPVPDALPWIADQRDALARPAADRFRALATRWPHVGPILLTAAQGLLTDGASDEAVELARRAFERLPGYGQRQVLAMALVSAGAGPELDQHLQVLAAREPRPERAWEIEVRAALTRGAPHHALDAVHRWSRAYPGSLGPVIWEVPVRLKRAEVDEARAAAIRASGATDLSIGALRMLAAAAFAWPVDRALAGRLASALEREDLRRDPESERLRHELLLASGAATKVPIDWARLQETGRVRWLSLEQAMGVIRTQATLAEFADRAWDAGIVAFEWWAGWRGIPVGAVGLGIARDEIAIVPPVPEIEPTTWRGRRIHLGGLAIEVLVALDLHAALADAVSGIVLFADTHERLVGGAMDTFVAALQTEREASDTGWLPYSGLPIVERDDAVGARLGESDVPAVAAWLALLGFAPSAEGPPWVPPTGRVALDGLAILGLHRRGLSERFLDACRKVGLVVGVTREAVDSREARRREISLRTEAARIADRAWRWLAALEAEGKLEVRAVPDGPPLPPLPTGEPDPPWARRSFAARELLLADSELVLVGSELVELGVRGKGPLGLLVGRLWTPEASSEHEVRYERIAERQVTFAAVVRDLVPEGSARRADVVGHLARAGYVDALTGSDVRSLYRRFGGLAGEEPRAQLVGTVRWLSSTERRVHAPVLGAFAVLPLMDALVEIWSASDPDQVEARAEETAAVLDAAAEMDRATRGAYRLLDVLLAYLAGQTVRRPEWFVKPVAQAYELAPDLAGQILWRTIGNWAIRARRWGSVQLAVAQAIREEPEQLGVAELMYAAMVGIVPIPVNEGTVDMTGIATASLLNRRVAFPRALGQVLLAGHPPRAIGEWRTIAVAGIRRAEIGEIGDLEVDAAGTLVHLPLEGVIPEVLPRAAEIIDRLWFHDGALAKALARWAEVPSDETERAVRASLDASPLRAVRADPRVILAWSRWRDPGVVGPRSLRELRALLAEPEDLTPDTDIVRVVDARLDPGGTWDGRDHLPIARQLARIPGGFLGLARPEVDDEGLAWQVRLPEDHADYPTGELVGTLFALGVAGKSNPIRRLNDVEVRLPELVARTAAATLTPTDDPARSSQDDYAWHEPGLVRICGSVVDAVADQRPDPGERVWLVWRLFAWLTSQILGSDHPIEAARALAELAPAQERVGVDPYDPARIGRGAIDLRELSVLQVLFRLRVEGAVDWRVLQPTLLRVACRDLTPDEREVREGWTDTSLGGVALLAPDLARALALHADLDVISLLAPADRLAWLDDALRVRPTEHPLQIVAGHVLAAFALRVPQWSEAEADLIHAAVDRPEFQVSDTGSATLLVAAAGRWPADEALRASAWSVVRARLSDAVSDALVIQEWILASARAGRLHEAVGSLRAELAARAIDELPFLSGLSRPLLDPDLRVRAQARAMVDALATEPRLAEAPVVRWLVDHRGDTGTA